MVFNEGRQVTRLSISRAWDEARAVLVRDRGPIATVALALIVLPGTLAELIVPTATPGASPDMGWSFVGMLVLLISIVGQLTVSRIALGQRQSVGEAMAHGARRSPAFLGAALIWLLPFAIVATPFAMQVQASPNQPPPTAALVLFAAAMVFLFVGVRLVFATPVSVNETVGPIGILKRSWQLTAGHWWRLFGFLVLFMIAALILIGAVTAVIGVVVALVSGQPERLSVGALVIALITQLVAALVTVLLTVLLARLYLQLAGASGEPVSVPDAP